MCILFLLCISFSMIHISNIEKQFFFSFDFFFYIYSVLFRYFTNNKELVTKASNIFYRIYTDKRIKTAQPSTSKNNVDNTPPDTTTKTTAKAAAIMKNIQSTCRRAIKHNIKCMFIIITIIIIKRIKWNDEWIPV